MEYLFIFVVTTIENNCHHSLYDRNMIKYECDARSPT